MKSLFHAYLKVHSNSWFGSLGLILIGVLVTGCAQQVPPSGGEKDTVPPKLVHSDPPNKSTNFDQESIELEFNEFIQLGNTRQEIFVSPPLEKDPEAVARRKMLRLKLPGFLEPNTTYSIYFNQAVKDLTEGNAAEGLKYVFSTGSQLDSLVVTGNVVNGRDLSPAKDVFVGLYKDFNDSAVIKNKPFYLAKTGEKGQYRFENVKEGPYAIFVLADQNQNLKLDPGEKLGFSLDTLMVDSDTVKAPRISLSKQFMEPLKVVNSKMPRPGKIRVEFSRRVDTVEFSVGNVRGKKAESYTKISPKGDNAYHWFTPIQRDSLSVIIRINEHLTDTLTFKRSDDFFKNPVDSVFNIDFARDTFLPKTPFFLEFPEPVVWVRNGCVSLHKNDSTDKALQPLDFHVGGASSTMGKVEFPLKSDSTYHFRIDSGCMKNVYQEPNKGFEKRIKVKRKESLGLLEVNVNRTRWKENVLIHLVSNDGKIVRKKVIRKDKKLVFENLFPGKFRIRAILDQYGNGYWDGGDWLTRKEPEPVFYYGEPLTLKANWEVRDITFQVPVD